MCAASSRHALRTSYIYIYVGLSLSIYTPTLAYIHANSANITHKHTHTQARSTHKLNLDDYNLVNFPPEILNLPNLRLLSLKNNQLEDVPEEIAILSRLEVNRQHKKVEILMQVLVQKYKY